jgi:hypothetical protein
LLSLVYDEARLLAPKHTIPMAVGCTNANAIRIQQTILPLRRARLVRADAVAAFSNFRPTQVAASLTAT